MSNNIEDMARLTIDSINKTIQKNIVKQSEQVFYEDSFLIENVKKHVFGSGSGNYVPPHNVFRDSEIGHECFRFLQLKKAFPDLLTPFSLNTQGKFSNGNAIHEYEQAKLPKTVIVAKELNIEKKYKDISLRGHIDLLVAHPDYGVMVTDIKTMSEKAFYWLDRNGISKEYQIQANNYANKIISPMFSIYCISKEDHKMREYFFEQKPALYNAMQEKAQFLYIAISEKYLLPRHPGFPDNFWQCQYEEKDYKGYQTGNTIRCPAFDICERANQFQDLENLIEE